MAPSGPQTVRLAVVDIGTNTTRLYIADVAGGEITEELTRHSRVTRLGAGVDASRRLAESALEREYAVLADYRDEIRASQADRAIAVMTSAVRDAGNGRDLAQTVSDVYGIEAHILSGDEEARLTYLGATSGDHHRSPSPGGSTLVCDIGGGSTELVIGHGDAVDFHVSTQNGVVRQADRHIRHDPPTDAELEQTAADVRLSLEAAVPARWRTGIRRALAVAGTPTTLAAIAQELAPYDPERVHGYRLSATERDRIFERLRVLPLQQLKLVAGLHPDRASAIVPGIVILTEVMRLFGLQAVEASEHDILRGAALAYA